MGPNKTPNPMKKQVTIDEGANTMSPPHSLPTPPCPLGGRGGSSLSPQGEAREELGEKLAMVAELVPSNGGRSEIYRNQLGNPLGSCSQSNWSILAFWSTASTARGHRWFLFWRKAVRRKAS